MGRDFRTSGVGRRDIRTSGLSGGGTPSTETIIPTALYAKSQTYSLTGFAWPFSFSSGRVSVSGDTQHIIESIEQIVGTCKMELPMKLDYGSDLPRRVFSPVNISALVERDVREALFIWEKRVDINSIHAAYQDNQINIRVSVKIKGSGEILNVNTNIGG